MKQTPAVGLNRRGFTLLEVTIACFLLALIAGIATLSLRGQVDSNKLQQAMEQLERADRFCRELSRRAGSQAVIEFDIADHQIRIELNRRTQKSYSLPDGVALEEVQQAKIRARDVIVSPLGQSPTYAVQFGTGKQNAWLVVAGASGNTLRTRNEEQVNALLRF